MHTNGVNGLVKYSNGTVKKGRKSNVVKHLEARMERLGHLIYDLEEYLTSYKTASVSLHSVGRLSNISATIDHLKLEVYRLNDQITQERMVK